MKALQGVTKVAYLTDYTERASEVDVNMARLLRSA